MHPISSLSLRSPNLASILTLGLPYQYITDLSDEGYVWRSRLSAMTEVGEGDPMQDDLLSGALHERLLSKIIHTDAKKLHGKPEDIALVKSRL